MKNKGLEKLRCDRFFQKGSSDFLQDEFSLVRVTEIKRKSYMVSDGKHEMLAELSGKFLFDAENTIDYPTVKDWVTIQAMNSITTLRKLKLLSCMIPTCQE